ncbi:bactofilin family protein [Rubrimonas cliftonensis]|uniref:Protein CcmA, bactofilin family n=1 Tax=Rubrimonas cliftonensis TaxID=89524 RepID=A0A1H4BCP1_9RHOB|nr:polymer-forming cytoskeletal protein [Rubrimonas cliftonensis]SEA45929.1 protein CcmA, bactofilin family [Rubrimonas cliftonensis]
MFSKPKITEPIEPAAPKLQERAEPAQQGYGQPPAAAAKPKPAPSSISSDLTVVGNITTTGDMQVDGIIEGDIRAHLLTVGEGATISGEIMADDIVIHGLIRGRVRGVKVRLTSTAKVEGDIIHKTIAIESGAHFEGSVQRRDDPLGDGKPSPTPAPARASEPAKPSAPAKPGGGDTGA